MPTTLQYTTLGKSGLRVSDACLGAMNFGTEWSYGLDRETCRAVFDAFTEAGGNFIDTAAMYTKGASETIVGELIASDRDHFVCATQYTPGPPSGDIVMSGNSRKNMIGSLNKSLKRMKTDYVDLFFIHFWDFTTPSEEILRGLDDLVRSGKVLYIGVSNVPAWIIARSDLMAELRGWSRFIAMQVPYSLVERTAERELFPMADALDLAVLAWSPLHHGILAGRYGAADAVTNQGRPIEPRQREIAEVLVHVARDIGAAPAQVALAWIWQRRTPRAMPIVSADTPDQMRASLAAIDLVLDEATLRKLDDATAVAPGFPYGFIGNDTFRNLGTSYNRERLRMPERPRF